MNALHIWLSRLSTSKRFMLLQWVLTIAALLPVVLFTYLKLDARVESYYRDGLVVRSRNLMFSYRSGGIPSLTRSINERLTAGGLQEAAYLLVDAGGHRLAGNVARWPVDVPVPAVQLVTIIRRDGHQQSEPASVNTFRLGNGGSLLVGSVSLARKKAERALMEPILVALLLLLPIALILSRIQEAYVSRHMKSITDVSNAIARGDLGRRIDTNRTSDDFARLSSSLNRTFARIQTLFDNLIFVTDALAHELRSPLMRVQAELERLETAKLADKAESLRRVRTETEGMLRTISATLDLSRAEAGLRDSALASFDIRKLMDDLWEVYEPSAEAQNIELVLGRCDQVQCFGSRELVAQALSNLLDNALRHSGARRVELGCIHKHTGCVLWVADDGIGIAEHQRAEALRKFGRLDRSSVSEGSGLGLAFVSAVAKAHGGNLTLKDNNPGLRVELNLPLIEWRGAPTKSSH